MAIFNALFKNNAAYNIEDAFGAEDITTPAMQSAIAEWFSLYFDRDCKCDSSSASNIPYVVVDGLYKACFGEYEATINAESLKDAEMVRVLQNLDDVRASIFQQTLIGGEGFIKPVPFRDTFRFVFIPRNCYAVLARDSAGEITSVGTCEFTVRGRTTYTLAERRTIEDGRLHIENKLFESNGLGDLGKRVPLSTLYDWLEEDIYLNIPHLGLTHIKLPIVNCVDGSSDGVSVYAAAVDEINTLYWHEQRTNDEFELTAPHAVVSVDVLNHYKYGHTEIPKFAMSLDENPSDVGFSVYNPTPNQQQLESRANQLLRSIENIVGLRRGFLSHVESDDKTATAVIASSSRFALMVAGLQTMWVGAVLETLALCDKLGQLYFGWRSEEYSEPIISWGNGVLYDEDKEYQRLYGLAQSGYLRPEYLLRWMQLHSMSNEELEEIRSEFMPAGGGRLLNFDGDLVL